MPGWHGKLPTLGDFASRRLDAAFIEPWDAWLAASLLCVRTAQPDTWLDRYLASPSWRFLLCPGALPAAAGQQGWAGVLMPSVDRVGRYFPLTLVRPLGDAPVNTQQMDGLWHWLTRLDELAAEAVQKDWTVARLEDELTHLAEPVLSPPQGQGDDAALAIGLEAQTLWRQQARGRSYWHASTELRASRLLICQGLPGPDDAALLLASAPEAA